MLIVACIFSIASFSLVLFSSLYGFDFTDEGFYLNLISNPADYDSISLFGYIYNPIYSNFGIIGLRVINALVIYFSIMGVFAHILRLNFKKLTLQEIILFSFSFSSAGLIVFVFNGLWLHTPSYNHLTFIGLIVSAWGILLTDKNESSFFSLLVLVFGVWIVFLGKISSAAILVLILLGLLAYKTYIGMLDKPIKTYTTIITLVVIFTIITDVMLYSRGGIYQNFELAYQNVQILGGHSKSLFRLEIFNLISAINLKHFLIFLVTFFASYRINNQSSLSVQLAWPILIVVMLTFSRPSTHLIAYPVILGYFFILLRKVKWNYLRDRSACVIFLFFPYVYAFGTNNSYWIPISSSFVFLIFFLLFITNEEQIKFLKSFALVMQILSLYFILTGLQHPYRQATNIFDANFSAEVNGESVQVKSETAYLINNAQRVFLSETKEFSPDEKFVIDLTGLYPGLIYAIGGRSLGSPWMLAGYPGSIQLASNYLIRVPCSDLSRAWLIASAQIEESYFYPLLSYFGFQISYYTVIEIPSYEKDLPVVFLKPNPNRQQELKNCA